MVDWSRMRGRRQIVSGPGLKLLIGLITNRKGGNVWVLREVRRSLTSLVDLGRGRPKWCLPESSSHR